jgi:hypothetical protein
MPTYSLKYKFRQRLDAPARAAYAWCTDFEPADGKLFPVRWKRSVSRLTEDALILTDTTYPKEGVRRIHRLVRLNPSETAWTNTHLGGPFRHSQYWYRVVPDGSHRSHLEFRGLRLVTNPQPLSSIEISELTAIERNSDSDLWRRRIAPALKEDLARRSRRS